MEYLKKIRKIIGAGALSVSTLFSSYFLKAQEQFRRGDVDNNGRIELNDPIITLDYLFRRGPEPECMDSADLDDNGGIEINDAVYCLNYSFRGGRQPEQPFPVAGYDLTRDSLGCRGVPDLEERLVRQTDIPLLINEPHASGSINYLLLEDVEFEGTLIEIQDTNFVFFNGNGKIVRCLDKSRDYAIKLTGSAGCRLNNFNIESDGGGILLVQSHDAVISNSSITARAGIALSSNSYGTTISNNLLNINGLNSSAIESNSSSGNSLVGNYIEVLGNDSIGLELIGSMNNFILGNSILTSGSNSSAIGFFRIFDSFSDNSYIGGNNFSTFGGSSPAIQLQSSSNNQFEGNMVETYGGFSPLVKFFRGGLTERTSSDNYFYNFQGLANGAGSNGLEFYLGNHNNNRFVSSNINSVENNVFFVDSASGSVCFTDVLLANERNHFDSLGNAKLFRKWYADFSVFDRNDRPIPDANLSIFDVGNNPVFSGLSDSNGSMPRQEILAYVQDSNGVFNENYRIEVSHPDYQTVVREIGGDINPITGNLDLEFILERRK